MDKGAFGRLKSLPKQGMGAFGEFSPQSFAYDFGICATF